MGTIELTQGRVAIVDDADFEWLNQWKWGYSHGYARRIEHDYTNGWRHRTTKRIYMHRLILGANSEQLVDHINQDKLDNTRGNLRFADKSINAFNSKVRADNTTGYKGVYQRGDKFYSQITKNGKTKCLGTYKTAEEASRARQKEYLYTN